MNTLPHTYKLREVLMRGMVRRLPETAVHPSEAQRVRRELREAGVKRFGLSSTESRYLPHIIQPDEHITGAVFGYQEVGFSMLIATTLRVIFLDRKPLFHNHDDITYDVVCGVTFNHAILGSTVTLHTRIKDIKIYTLNTASAEKFAEYIDKYRLENDPPIKELML